MYKRAPPGPPLPPAVFLPLAPCGAAASGGGTSRCSMDSDTCGRRHPRPHHRHYLTASSRRMRRGALAPSLPGRNRKRLQALAAAGAEQSMCADGAGSAMRGRRAGGGGGAGPQRGGPGARHKRSSARVQRRTCRPRPASSRSSTRLMSYEYVATCKASRWRWAANALATEPGSRRRRRRRRCMALVTWSHGRAPRDAYWWQRCARDRRCGERRCYGAGRRSAGGDLATASARTVGWSTLAAAPPSRLRTASLPPQIHHSPRWGAPRWRQWPSP